MGKEAQFPLCADGTPSDTGDPQNHTRRLQEVINSFSKVAGHKNQLTETHRCSLYQRQRPREGDQGNSPFRSSLKTMTKQTKTQG